ncbi:hypothetical protein M0805_006298 [Coniferiporia weirii]|nr:hypothetical protein M0805_006298 [Coniferiporia weirii]
MTAAVTANGSSSPHSSHPSSPPSKSSPLASSPDAPSFDRDDFLRFAQNALANAYREQLARQRSAGTHPQTPAPLEDRVMKPRIHMYESYDSPRTMIATLELPGLQKSDIAITARPNGDLIVAGERRPQHLQYLHAAQGSHNDSDSERTEKGRTVFNELKFGKFQRVIRLPNGTDPTRINASMDDGMLTICWPLPDPNSSSPPCSPSEESQRPQGDDVTMEETDTKRTTLRSS